ARALAGRGLPSLRFDLSGLGDSAAARGDTPFKDVAIADTRAALDAVEAGPNWRDIVLFGLCSGADIALRVALEDPRVTGLVLVNPTDLSPQCEHDPEDSTREARASLQMRLYRGRLFRWGSWMRLLRGKSDVRAIGRTAIMAARRLLPCFRPGREIPLNDCRTFLTRGRALVILAEGSVSWDMFHKPLSGLAHAHPGLELRTLRGADHILTPSHSQVSLMKSLDEWLDGWPSASPPPDAR
ncbi:MAG: alpha/beta hydrolase, partial [Planctomycetes bacterium]|nr:alpha/beta hydrolase [Planctomycetota bacterium]